MQISFDLCKKLVCLYLNISLIWTTLFVSSISSEIDEISFPKQLRELESILFPVSPKYSTSTFRVLSEYYGDLLEKSRARYIFRPSRDRISDIGELLCSDASTYVLSVYLENKINIIWQWQDWIQQLHEHEIKLNDCQQFYKYYKLGWNPQFFHWPILSASGDLFLKKILEYNTSDGKIYGSIQLQQDLATQP